MKASTLSDAPPAARVDAPKAMSLPVVGIGASAGGLKALQQLIEAIPKDTGFAYVVIVHLDPKRESRMGQLLQDRTSMPVTQVNAPTSLEANHIYLIPPGHDLVLHAHNIELQDRGERAEHAPIDLFFRTMAESCGTSAVGVVLSGTGADGTAGIRYIREAGGTTIAQSPEEAEYNGMPVSAISTGLIDVVLPSAEIPAELVRLRDHPAHLSDGAAANTPDTEAALAQVFGTLRSRTGHDFSLYKRSTVMRRLERRLRFNNVSTLQDYQAVMHASSTESQALLRDLLISVSSFFRDPEAFEAFAGQLPAVFEGKGPTDAVRVWVVGCATGEEVYSLAIVLTEYAATLSDPPRLQLFATDIDEHGYAWARAGLYSPSSVAGITPERVERFFTKEPGGYRIAKSLRELVLFAGHNALHDPPFSRMDVISCRNFFIYLQPEAQERVLETFHFALNPNALLFLGASESVGDSVLFAPIAGSKHRLFRRNSSPYRVAPRLSAADLKPGAFRNTTTPTKAHTPQFSYGATHLRMLEQYASASVIVNERLDVVHMSPNAGRFLRLGEGEPNHNLLGLAREDLRRVLRTALHQAFNGATATTRRVVMTVDGIAQQIDVQVRPSVDDNGGRFALIVFEIADADASVTPASGDHGQGHGEESEVELQEELNRTRDLLESTRIAHDRTVAELQTVNEELQSINEEQKAASEELETGREEIQSINEELTTINQEHQSTIEELKRTNGDLQNLIESTEIGTVFLDRAMRVRRFTPAAASVFNFVATDQGRPLSHITHRLKYPSLFDDVARVLASLQRIECEVDSDTGESFIVRINPYRSIDGDNEGAVLTFFNNTAQHRVAKELREAKLVAESANLAKSNFLSTLSHEFRTPLNGILGYADLLDVGNRLTPDQLTKVQRIKAGGWHLAAMIEEILSFAKLDGGHEVVEPLTLDARAIAREAGDLIEPSAVHKSLAVVVELPDTPVMVVTDPDKARQILINICGNAVKYTHDGEIHLSVRTAGDRVCFDIKDTGVGIAPEYHEKIFERFWQVSGGTTRAAGGMGIGLSAAREYARLLHGDVEVESVLGKGTTFHFWLPVAYEPD